MNKNRINIEFEGVLGIIFLILFFYLFIIAGLKERTILFPGIIIGIPAFLLGKMKFYINKQNINFFDIWRNLMQELFKGSELNISLSYKFSLLEEPNLFNAKQLLSETVAKMDKGERNLIPFYEIDYFIKIIYETKCLKNGDIIIDLNSFKEKRFYFDFREEVFYERYTKALNRDEKIERIFTFEEHLLNIKEEKSRLSAIGKNQKMESIVFFVSKTNLLGQKNLYLDCAIYDGENPHFYSDFQYKVNETGFFDGELRFNSIDFIEFRKYFKIRKENTISEVEPKNLFNKLN